MRCQLASLARREPAAAEVSPPACRGAARGGDREALRSRPCAGGATVSTLDLCCGPTPELVLLTGPTPGATAWTEAAATLVGRAPALPAWQRLDVRVVQLRWGGLRQLCWLAADRDSSEAVSICTVIATQGHLLLHPMLCLDGASASPVPLCPTSQDNICQGKIFGSADP